MPEPQAETVVRQQARLLEQNFVTKTDVAAIQTNIETLRKETTASIETLRQETIARVEAAKMDLIKWLFGVNFGTASLIVALIKLL